MAAASLGCDATGAQATPNHGPQITDRRDLLGAFEHGRQSGGRLVER
jgi:hypothetical protein